MVLNFLKDNISLRNVFKDCIFGRYFLKDTHREKAPPNKTPASTKSTDMGIWVGGTSNQFSIRGS